jgi:hypothetical protein
MALPLKPRVDHMAHVKHHAEKIATQHVKYVLKQMLRAIALHIMIVILAEFIGAVAIYNRRPSAAKCYLKLARVQTLPIMVA